MVSSRRVCGRDSTVAGEQVPLCSGDDGWVVSPTGPLKPHIATRSSRRSTRTHGTRVEPRWTRSPVPAPTRAVGEREPKRTASTPSNSVLARSLFAKDPRLPGLTSCGSFRSPMHAGCVTRPRRETRGSNPLADPGTSVQSRGRCGRTVVAGRRTRPQRIPTRLPGRRNDGGPTVTPCEPSIASRYVLRLRCSACPARPPFPGV